MEKPRILVVEDESIVALDICDRLQHLEYTVAAMASSGEEAIERTAELHPDVVLMDIRMPGALDGIEAAAQICERFEIPVVFITAYADASTLERAKVTTPFGYVLKPFEDRDLQVAVEVALYKYKVEQELKQRVRELTALNKMFQKHLTEWFTVVQAYRDLRRSLRSLVQELNAVVERAESHPIPDLMEISDLIQGEDSTPADK